MPAPTPPAGESPVQDLHEGTKRGSVLVQLTARRKDVRSDKVLREVIDVEHAGYGAEHTGQGEELTVGAQGEGRQAVEVGRQGYEVEEVVIGSEDEVRVLGHEDGEEVEDEVHDGEGAEAAPDEVGLSEAAAVAGLSDDRDGGHVDGGATGDMAGRGDLGSGDD